MKQASTSSQPVRWVERSPGLIVRRAATDFGWFVLSLIVRTSIAWIHMKKTKPIQSQTNPIPAVSAVKLGKLSGTF
jgi:hypothetical protein